MRYDILADDDHITFRFMDTSNFTVPERGSFRIDDRWYTCLHGWIIRSSNYPEVIDSELIVYLPGNMVFDDTRMCFCDIERWDSLRKVLYTVCSMVNRGEFRFTNRERE
jgi:hypothetical protein